MIQVVKNKPKLRSFASIEFKHRKSNFYTYVRSRKKLISQLSCGNIIGYNKKSSKRQKIKHVSEQLAEVSAAKFNTFFHRRKRRRFLRFDLRQIYRKLGLRSAFLRLLTENQHNRNLYTKIMKNNLTIDKPRTKIQTKWSVSRVLNYFPSLTSIYMIALTPYRFTRKKTRSLRRFIRLKRKYPIVHLRKLNFDKKRARSLFFKFVFKSKLKRKKFKYFKRAKVKKLF